jgi:cytochrome d ubiquinol oxidase subunit I
MKRLPRDPMPDLDEGPIRTSGIMPGPAAGAHAGSTHAGNTRGSTHHGH